MSTVRTLRVRLLGLGMVGPLLLAPAVLASVRIAPAHGPVLGLRLAVAAICVLILPGALILRSVGWPSRPAVAAAGTFGWSLVAIFLALLFTFVVHGSLSLTFWMLVAISVAALIVALLVPSPADPPDRRDTL